MKKSTVIAYFGGTVETAAALKVSRPAVIQWPEDLPFSVLGRIASLQPRAWKVLNRQEKEQQKAA